ncbi:MAG: aminotransferase class III-fold pyridoxal phosphate-dependent enzyme [Pelagibacteraceae bacterium]|jgi:glutamate-1-semialdehyde 2,1-aminomutase|nr:aminotransferase class III-fold pyridoxal phosphate-dependent enzyme [Pelagibacteraceae bacterium]MBT3901532.1 aminotransferase class III-fold pyridoxal phosphate-dependent enzyme [Pelagibacteraceae bacterium]MBT4646618.1 aminotransferase class III-fold pyridoxal phosphate-dependent enzyme [Pelagibacteraceae bacterium]MBT4950860.1 aminotransferase class III-fold pyridoxal phosphate-dependent enzyme [Pelagibacteraceae bacterium]MBT5214604.1 aminotransferase class III-fold pyridoxal phosphate-
MGKGQKLYSKAKKIVAGGNMLLSKRPEMFLPEHWPSYFSKTKGCEVWDLDGNKYIDTLMMPGTNSLGYNNPEVDEAVKETISNGNMSTLNAPEEVELTERLVELHPWADMARFARSGGEANSVAIRLARAASGKDNVAFCGYHGWHDWYLASNLSDSKGLDKHLLPGLDPHGVPQNLKGSVHPFEYNNYAKLEELVSTKNIGVIKMEVFRNKEPEDNFLHKVRKLADDNNIVLVFDECTSGFRKNYGGLHKLYDVEPDVAMFGKALGNGFAVTAVLGKEEVMKAAEKSFISSTFWTERIGSSAALATLKVMQREKSWEKITNTGEKINTAWIALSKEFDLPITISGLSALTTFTFKSDNALAYKTLITQEMLKKGYLAATAVYACTEHSASIMDEYLENLKPIFQIIKECEEGRDVMSLLEGPVAHNGFKRLN